MNDTHDTPADPFARRRRLCLRLAVAAVAAFVLLAIVASRLPAADAGFAREEFWVDTNALDPFEQGRLHVHRDLVLRTAPDGPALDRSGSIFERATTLSSRSWW
jgi:hypothetical protein